MEYAQGGDLLKLVQNHSKRGQRLPESQIWKVLVHTARALRALHHQKVLHRDLKGANIFLTA
ncbi:MAG: protein kinase [Bdellovibrionales bacterium]|nr:protein kinase [Bdellovibrionales bacterium]